MRHAQTAYRKDRTQANLDEVRYLEKLCDVAIAEELKPLASPSLFDRIVEDVEKV